MDNNQEPLDQAQIQPAPPTEYQALVQDDLTARARSVASWFYWVAGLSLVNTLMVMGNADVAFSLGLGITQMIDGVIQYTRTTDELNGKGISGLLIAGWIADFLILAFFVTLGVVFTRRRAAWALWIGIILYALDSLFFLAAGAWFAFAFHGFVVYRLSRGFAVLKDARQIAAE